MLRDNLTILVCSCDKYADLWDPFFMLLKKYWNPKDIRILLNTESTNFSYDGLNIECVLSPNEKRYGQRMLNALAQVRTKYVLLMLDDFFLRSPVNTGRIEEIIGWMEKDVDIVCFNCDPNPTYTDFEVDKYPGFKRIPPGNPYMLSFQAAVWRTDVLKDSWLPSVNPWEWEECTSAHICRWTRKKFYCLHDIEASFMDYGHYRYGDIWGVYRGKWCIEDIQPLFEREGLHMDFSKRGIFDPSEKPDDVLPDDWGTFEQIARCMGKNEKARFYLFNRYCQLLTLLKKPVNWNYYAFLRERAQEKFLKKRRLDKKNRRKLHALR